MLAAAFINPLLIGAGMLNGCPVNDEATISYAQAVT
jgi:hypothetical protein